MARLTRRKFLASAAASTLVAPMFARDPKPGGKLNVAVIGVNNRGAANVAGVEHENVVALCDVDEEWSGVLTTTASNVLLALSNSLR